VPAVPVGGPWYVCLSGASLNHLWGFLKPPGGLLGGVLGASRKPLGLLFGPSRGPLGGLLGHLEGFLSRLWALVGRQWALWGAA